MVRRCNDIAFPAEHNYASVIKLSLGDIASDKIDDRF